MVSEIRSPICIQIPVSILPEMIRNSARVMNRIGIVVQILSSLVFDFSSSIFSRVSTDICSRILPVSGINEHSMLLTGSSVGGITNEPLIRTEVIKEFSFFLFLRELIIFCTEITPSKNRGYLRFILYMVNIFYSVYALNYQVYYES